jgi:hypothetical protein
MSMQIKAINDVSYAVCDSKEFALLVKERGEVDAYMGFSTASPESWVGRLPFLTSYEWKDCGIIQRYGERIPVARFIVDNRRMAFAIKHSDVPPQQELLSPCGNRLKGWIVFLIQSGIFEYESLTIYRTPEEAAKKALGIIEEFHCQYDYEPKDYEDLQEKARSLECMELTGDDALYIVPLIDRS